MVTLAAMASMVTAALSPPHIEKRRDRGDLVGFARHFDALRKRTPQTHEKS
jgi:hypothetical protein